MPNKLRNLIEFIRPKLCVFVACISAIGYLLFNELSSNILFVLLSSFFVCAGAYSYNNMTDKKEDYINRKRLNPFVSSINGKRIVCACLLAGFSFSLFLSFSSVLFYISSAVTGIIYSKFAVKKHFIIKNIYTGFGVMQAFLIGASVSAPTLEAFYYYIALSLFVVIGSIISDMRDYTGDKSAGIKTIPVHFGYGITKALVLILLGIYAFFIIYSFVRLFSLLPFIGLMSFFVYKNKISYAHLSGSLSFVFLMVTLMIS